MQGGPAVLGVDVGGANLKTAHADGTARSLPFALWRNPGGLADALDKLFARLSPFDALAVTMTGELCDCFETRRQGVQHILDAVEKAAGDRLVKVWSCEGTWTDLPQARARPLEVAAANWLCLATFAGRFTPTGHAVLVDVGSTTTDLVPIIGGRPRPAGRTDLERLRSGELVYTGVRRTPLCALLGPMAAAELFATTLDAYLVLGLTAERPEDTDTADGRPATRSAAHARLARMLCMDGETCPPQETHRLAQDATNRQVHAIRTALERVLQTLPAPPDTFILSGSGEFLARHVIEGVRSGSSVPLVSLGELLGPGISTAACAYAAAVLLAEALTRGG